MSQQPLYIREDDVKRLLKWEEMYDAAKVALLSASNETFSQPARSFTTTSESGLLLTMPCYLDNYQLPSLSREKLYRTLACKLVTSFPANASRSPALPKILGNIFLFNPESGQLQAILEATLITAWRTACASLVATQCLYFDSRWKQQDVILSIVGCGVQGRIHSIGMCTTFPFSEVRLWNRTESKATQLADELRGLAQQFRKPSIAISVHASLTTCLADSDVIVIATSSHEPLIQRHQLKDDVHINTIGAGEVHHAELHQNVYDASKVYTDHWEGAKTELKELKAEIVGLVGEVLGQKKPTPSAGITIFQSLGMALEDATSAQVIVEAYKMTHG
ncbi:ketimine reductase mu-crystallin [Phlebotomus argentipes]|uniref:ketimine reductase mu-crystallin n=1 Tax=Phlebotomus argentipes TaxID=94469 RepID=UPI00289310EA|nr:ketimine reductase mu-crystallin [Phlebotomus argentipes]